MRKRAQLALCVMLLGCAGRSIAQSPEYNIYQKSETRSFEQLIDAAANSDIVFLGEFHDHKKGHQLQLDIVKALAAKPRKIALSMEMFERDTQEVLNEYLGGFITESSFLAASRPWPNYKEDYRPLVEFCKEKGFPVVAANAPRRYVSIVSRKGPDALRTLPKFSRSHLAPLPYSLVLPEGYDRALNEIFGDQHATGGAPTATPNPNMPSAANMKAAQALWDATMADSVVRATRQNRGAAVVQMNGSMHSDNGYGIVERVKKALPRARILIISIKPDAAFPNPDLKKMEGVADFLIITPQEEKKK